MVLIRRCSSFSLYVSRTIVYVVSSTSLLGVKHLASHQQRLRCLRLTSGNSKLRHSSCFARIFLLVIGQTTLLGTVMNKYVNCRSMQPVSHLPVFSVASIEDVSLKDRGWWLERGPSVGDETLKGLGMLQVHCNDGLWSRGSIFAPVTCREKILKPFVDGLTNRLLVWEIF